MYYYDNPYRMLQYKLRRLPRPGISQNNYILLCNPNCFIKRVLLKILPVIGTKP